MQKKERVVKKKVYKKRDDGKNDTGRPAKYKTAEELQKKIDEYFDGGYRMKTIYIKKGKDTIPISVPAITITGLVIYLGFADKQSFYDLENVEKFSYSIKRARTFIEREYEEQLSLNPTGAIFALKNFKRTDKNETDLNVKGDIKIQDITIKIGD